MASRRAELLKELLARINEYGADSRLEDYAEYGPPGNPQEFTDHDRRVSEIFALAAEFRSTLEAKTSTTIWTDSLEGDLVKLETRLREKLNAMPGLNRASFNQAVPRAC